MKTVLWIIGIFVLLMGLDYGYGYFVTNKKNVKFSPKGQIVFEQNAGIGVYELTEKKETSFDSQEKIKGKYPNWDQKGERIVYLDKTSEKLYGYILDFSESKKQTLISKIDVDNDVQNFLLERIFWINDGLVAFLKPKVGGYRVINVNTLEERDPTTIELDLAKSRELNTFLNTNPRSNSKFTATATYVETGFITSVGQDALYIRPRYSIYRKKITTGKPLTNLTWLDDYHFFVQDPDHIYLIRVDGTILKTLDGTNYDYSLQESPWDETTGIS